ncbi:MULTISPECIES: TetR/AcrR family transcriptional regulator [Clostridium]|uniref:TetR/AcrR family transcriptional regulator n=1 Tax=Clostridium frigoriphilum TaxID=443253 RepID=A0ABU7UML2_9CLOT|nr:TetR/AcrR family transcriptional regulator [Clostridium sp. DSM 17811]MBU3097777.1 TetR/AcrR family transcriptional regulator [Clostridium sp. DSM 17811]
MANERIIKQKLNRIENKSKILEATVQLLKEKGVEMVTVRNVCAKAGIAVGTFYYYFQNKDDLMFCFVSEGFYDADLRSPENNITGRIIELYMTLINHYRELGLPFMKSFYSNNNLALSAYMTETDGKFQMNSILAKSEDEMEKAYKLELIVEGTDLHMVCKDLCTIIKGSVFEWCLCNGSMDIESVVSRIITRYLDGYLVKKVG